MLSPCYRRAIAVLSPCTCRTAVERRFTKHAHGADRVSGSIGSPRSPRTPRSPRARARATPVPKPDSLTLSEVLSHNLGLEVFMKHLGKEWSKECLLSFIEFSQFQSFILSKKPEFKQDFTPVLDVRGISWPESAPRSQMATS